MPDQLALRFELDSDGTGELFAAARGEVFSGAGTAWFHTTELHAFGARLASCFPLASGAELRLEGGYWQANSSPPRLAEVLVGIRIYPIGTTGTLGVHLTLGDGEAGGQRPESRGRASFEILATYEDIRRFGIQVMKLTDTPGATAELFSDLA